jgi:U3 small nucleolar RNA-associated protein MPP10
MGLNNPYEKRKMREELSMARSRGKVTTGEKDIQATKFGSSGTFFKRLQAEAQDSIRAKDGTGGDDAKKSSQKPKSSAYKL